MTKTIATIYCHCAYSQVISKCTKSAVLDALKDAGIAFEAVPDLCELSAKHDPALKDWAKAESIRIVACYPRAVKWLFHAGQAPLPQESVEFLNMRVDSVEKIVSSLVANQRCHKAPKNIQLEKTGTWIPWFPVIDYDRCKNCQQCFNFCLFGVYELSEQGQVKVTNPANCKTNCPACARMCPQSAIIFPKYSRGPINGDEVDEQAIENKTRKGNLSELLEEDIYDVIGQRSKTGKRFSKDTTSAVLKKLQEELDIPAKVLASLSPGQIIQLEKKSDKKRAKTQFSRDNCDSRKGRQGSRSAGVRHYE